jgi:hypothetical protein
MSNLVKIWDVDLREFEGALDEEFRNFSNDKLKTVKLHLRFTFQYL